MAAVPSSEPLRVRIARWLGGSALTPIAAPAKVAEARKRGVSPEAVAAAGRRDDGTLDGYDPSLTLDRIFARPKPPKGVFPTGLAMDSAGLPACLPSAAGMVQWGGWENLRHEGLVFFGYPYLAQLMQRVEYRHGPMIWAEHATRKFFELKGPKEERVAELNKFLGPGEGNLDVKAAFQKAALIDQQMGRSQIFLDCDNYDRDRELVTPLPAKVTKVHRGRPLKRLRVLEPMWSYPGPYDSTNPLAPDFYKPRQWYVQGKTIDDSRMLTFVGKEMPDMLKPAYAFGGMSMTQEMKPYVDNWLRSRQSGSDLLSAFSVLSLKTNLDSAMNGGCGDDVFNRIDLFNRMRSNRGAWAIGMDEELESLAVPLSNVPEMISQSQEQMASAARIPLSIFLQITPTGLNSTSDGEQRNFYADIHAYQERVFRPNLHRLIEYAMLSLWGEIDPDITFEFPSLWQMSEKEAAEVGKIEAETDKIYLDGGVVSNEETRERIREDETGLYRGVNLEGEAPELPDEADNDNGDDVIAAE